MAHPLEGAFLKFDAALEHFQTLTNETVAYLHEGGDKPYDLTMEFNERESRFSLVGHVLRQPPLRLSTRIGDVVHNLASALDHAMFELVRYRAGREIEMTFFPLFGDIRLYRKQRRMRAWMRHLTPSERTLVYRVQPYRGGDFAFNHPLAQLYRLWNQDKHRTLHTTLTMIAEYGIKVAAVQDVSAVRKVEVRLGAVVDGAEVLRVYVVPDGPSPQVKLESEVTLDVSVDDGIRIRYALGATGDWVEHILNRIVGEAFPESPKWDAWKAAQHGS